MTPMKRGWPLLLGIYSTWKSPLKNSKTEEISILQLFLIYPFKQWNYYFVQECKMPDPYTSKYVYLILNKGGGVKSTTSGRDQPSVTGFQRNTHVRSIVYSGSARLKLHRRRMLYKRLFYHFPNSVHFASASSLKFSQDDHNKDNDWMWMKTLQYTLNNN